MSKTITIKAHLVGKRHLVLTGPGGTEQVCELEDPTDIGKGVLDVLKEAARLEDSSNRRTQEQTVQDGGSGQGQAKQEAPPSPPPSQGEATLADLLREPMVQSAAKSIWEGLASLSVKDPDADSG